MKRRKVLKARSTLSLKVECPGCGGEGTVLQVVDVRLDGTFAVPKTVPESAIIRCDACTKREAKEALDARKAKRRKPLRLVVDQ